MQHLLDMPTLIYSMYQQFFDSQEGLLKSARIEDPNLGLYFYLFLSAENFGRGKSGVQKDEWRARYDRTIHVIVTARHRVYTTVVGDEGHTDRPSPLIADVTAIDPSQWVNTCNHDSCWHEDGLRVYQEQWMEAYKHCYSHVPEEERIIPMNMHVHTRFGAFLSFNKAIQLVRVSRESTYDERNQYRDHLTKIERVPFGISLETQSKLSEV